jgi:hypothetical protein
MKKLIMESLLVFAVLVFVASSAMAEKPEDVMDNKSNVFQSGKRYAMNMTGKSDKGKKATSTTERQTFDPYISASDGDDATMKQLRMILFLMCCQEPGKLYR